MSIPSRIRMVSPILLIALLCALGVHVANAQDGGEVPARISYQGHLVSNGLPADGPERFVFSLQTENGDEVWREDQTLQVENGVFSAILGEEDGDDELAEVFREHGVLVLSIEHESDELDAMVLTSAPYALRAGFADEVARGAAVHSLNDRTGPVTLSGSGLLTVSEDDETILLSVDGDDLVQTLGVEDDDTELTGDIRFRGEGSVFVYQDGQDIVIRSVVISSERYKQDIRPLSDALALVQELEGVTFTWKEDGRQDMGLIAEDVAEVLPELIAYDESGETIEGIRYHGLIGLLVEALKEQQATISSLEARLTRIERLLEQE